MASDPVLRPLSRAGVGLLTDPGAGSRGLLVAFSDRNGGVSEAPYDTLNLAIRGGDVRERVLENRERAGRGCGVLDRRSGPQPAGTRARSHRGPCGGLRGPGRGGWADHACRWAGDRDPVGRLRHGRRRGGGWAGGPTCGVARTGGGGDRSGYRRPRVTFTGVDRPVHPLLLLRGGERGHRGLPLARPPDRRSTVTSISPRRPQRP